MNTMIEATAPKTDQLNADDLIGRTKTIKITEVRIKAGDQPISVFYEGDDGKPYKPCKSMARMMIHVWGDDAKQYIGKSMTLYCDPSIKFGPMQMGGIRISHMSHLDAPKTVMLTVTKASRKPFTVQPMETLPEPSPTADRAALGVAELIKRIHEAADSAGVLAILQDEKTIIQRKYLAAKRPELDSLIESAIAQFGDEPEAS